LLITNKIEHFPYNAKLVLIKMMIMMMMVTTTMTTTTTMMMVIMITTSISIIITMKTNEYKLVTILKLFYIFYLHNLLNNQEVKHTYFRFPIGEVTNKKQKTNQKRDTITRT